MHTSMVNGALENGVNDLTSCPECGSATLESRFDVETFQYGGREKPFMVTARIPSTRCATCGFRFYDEEAQGARHDAACRQLGVMTPSEIRTLRQDRYDFTQEEFGELTGLGVATIGRWERGAGIQNEAYDAFLYLLTFSENVERLRDRCGNTPRSPVPRWNQRSPDLSSDRPKDLVQLVEAYKREDRPRLQKVLDFYQGLESVSTAVKKATLAELPGGGRHPHQGEWRVKYETLSRMAAILGGQVQAIEACSSFDELYCLLKKVKRHERVKGFGELCIYDTALRIGAKQNLYPTSVYLHLGTKDGCKALGLPWKAKTLRPEVFPAAIQTLSPHEIEDFVCIYKDQFGGLEKSAAG